MFNVSLPGKIRTFDPSFVDSCDIHFTTERYWIEVDYYRYFAFQRGFLAADLSFFVLFESMPYSQIQSAKLISSDSGNGGRICTRRSSEYEPDEVLLLYPAADGQRIELCRFGFGGQADTMSCHL